MSRNRLIVVVQTILWSLLCVTYGACGEGLQKCSLAGPNSSCSNRQETSQPPSCAIELTCTDKPVQLGYSDGVCFRSTCPGIWALTHKRADQASFRNQYIAYRHYSYTGTWELKDRGSIESGPVTYRELFLVLPDDLIEFKLRDPDPNAAIEVVNLGYVKKGSVEELKKWLAYNIYLERPVFKNAESNSESRGGNEASFFHGGLAAMTRNLLCEIYSLGRILGLPSPW